VPGRASPRAGVAAQARARLTGRASPGTGTGQPRHEMDRAGPGLGRAKKTGFRAGHRVTGCMANYSLLQWLATSPMEIIFKSIKVEKTAR